MARAPIVKNKEKPDDRPKQGTEYTLRVRRVQEMEVTLLAKSRDATELAIDFGAFEKKNPGAWSEPRLEFSAIKEVKG